jgi:hypothetical protein
VAWPEMGSSCAIAVRMSLMASTLHSRRSAAITGSRVLSGSVLVKRAVGTLRWECSSSLPPGLGLMGQARHVL